MNDFIEWLASANGPDPALDALIAAAATKPDAPVGELALPYTASLEAALALAERALPGWGRDVGAPLGNVGWWAHVWREGFSISQDGTVWHAVEGLVGLQPDKSTGAGEFGRRAVYAPTAALAVCLAVVRALHAEAIAGAQGEQE